MKKLKKLLVGGFLALGCLVTSISLNTFKSNAAVVVDQTIPEISITSTEDGVACIDYSGLLSSNEFSGCSITGFSVEMWYEGISMHYNVNDDGNYVLTEHTTGTKAYANNNSTGNVTFIYTIKVLYKDINNKDCTESKSVKFTVSPKQGVTPTQTPVASLNPSTNTNTNINTTVSTDLNTPKIKAVNFSNGSADVILESKDDSVDGYEAKIYNAKTNKLVNKDTTYGTDIIFDNLSDNTAYYIKVRALKNISRNTYYSKWTSKYYVIPQPVAYLDKMVGLYKVRIGWNKIIGANRYIIYAKEKGSNSKYKKIAVTKSNKFVLSKVNKKKLVKYKKYHIKIVACVTDNNKTYKSDNSKYMWLKLS